MSLFRIVSSNEELECFLSILQKIDCFSNMEDINESDAGDLTSKALKWFEYRAEKSLQVLTSNFRVSSFKNEERSPTSNSAVTKDFLLEMIVHQPTSFLVPFE
jgi:hypothetical protein